MERFEEKNLKDLNNDLKNTDPQEDSPLNREKARAYFEDLYEKEVSFYWDKVIEAVKDDKKEEMIKLEERFKKDWIKDKMEDCEEVEYLNSKLENTRQEFIDAILDSVSGLERREGLYRIMDEVLTRRLDSAKDDKRLVESLKEGDMGGSNKGGDMCVMMGDVSFLALANEAGHDSGDELIRGIGDALNKAGEEFNMVSYRHGGDEITSLYEQREGEGSVWDAIEEIKQAVKDKSITQLEKYGLDPNIDYGVAYFKEACDVARDLLNYPATKEKLDLILKGKERSYEEDGKGESIADDREGQQEVFEKEFIKKGAVDELKDIWVEIADKRCFIDKCITRIGLLMRLFHEDRERYGDAMSFLRKGAYNISDEKVRELYGILYEEGDDSSEEVKEERFQKEVERFIFQKEKQTIIKAEGYKQVRSKFILAQAWGEMGDI